MMQEFQEALTRASAQMIDGVARFLPGALVLLVLVLGSLIIAIIVRYLTLRGLRGIDFDRRAVLLGFAPGDWTASRSASHAVAATAYWMILTLGLLLGLTALDAALPSRFATAALAYIPHLIAAALIVLAGVVLARFLARTVLIAAVNMHVQFARLLSLGVKWMVLIVAAAMALDHIGIGRTVLLLAFGILFGGIVLATALAVGLGAKDAVTRALERQMRAPADHEKMDHV